MHRHSTEDNANIRVPPPLIYAVPLALGLWLHHLIPLVQIPDPAGGVLRRVGAALVILALLLAGWAMLAFRRMRTSVIPVQPASALVIRGPYRFTRNPMYLAMATLYLGVSLWARALWPLLFLPAIVVIIQRAVIRREEAYLSRRFGDDYRHYLAQVRRWI